MAGQRSEEAIWAEIFPRKCLLAFVCCNDCAGSQGLQSATPLPSSEPIEYGHIFVGTWYQSRNFSVFNGFFGR